MVSVKVQIGPGAGANVRRIVLYGGVQEEVVVVENREGAWSGGIIGLMSRAGIGAPQLSPDFCERAARRVLSGLNFWGRQ